MASPCRSKIGDLSADDLENVTTEFAGNYADLLRDRVYILTYTNCALQLPLAVPSSKVTIEGAGTLGETSTSTPNTQSTTTLRGSGVEPTLCIGLALISLIISVF